MAVTETEKKPARKHANYFVVFLALAILTGIEITVYQLPIPKLPLLIPLALIKAALVAMFYMHLRFDRRLFSAVFVFGILVGVTLIGSMIILFSPGINAPYH